VVREGETGAVVGAKPETVKPVATGADDPDEKELEDEGGEDDALLGTELVLLRAEEGGLETGADEGALLGVEEGGCEGSDDELGGCEGAAEVGLDEGGGVLAELEEGTGGTLGAEDEGEGMFVTSEAELWALAYINECDDKTTSEKSVRMRTTGAEQQRMVG